MSIKLRTSWGALLVAGAMLIGSSTASASLIRVEYIGVAQSFVPSDLIGPYSDIRASFTVDTGYAQPIAHVGEGYVGSFTQRLLVSDFRLSSDGLELFAFKEPSAFGVFGGATWWPRPFPDGSWPYEGGVMVDDGVHSFQIHFDGSTLQALTEDAYRSSSDPFGDLLLTQSGVRTGTPGASIQAVGWGEWGRFTADVQSLSIYRVPEPSALAIALGSGAVLAVFRRRRLNAGKL